MKPQIGKPRFRSTALADGESGDSEVPLPRRPGNRHATLDELAAMLLLQAMKQIARAQWGKRVSTSERKRLL